MVKIEGNITHDLSRIRISGLFSGGDWVSSKVTDATITETRRRLIHPPTGTGTLAESQSSL